MQRGRKTKRINRLLALVQMGSANSHTLLMLAAPLLYVPKYIVDICGRKVYLTYIQIYSTYFSLPSFGCLNTPPFERSENDTVLTFVFFVLGW